MGIRRYYPLALAHESPASEGTYPFLRPQRRSQSDPRQPRESRCVITIIKERLSSGRAINQKK